MSSYSNAELADIHFIYGLADGNALEASRLYRERFPNRRHPDSRTFTSIHRRISETGAVQVRRPDAGRNLDVELERRVLQYFVQHPTASTRAAADVLGVENHTTIWHILNNNGQHPYRYQKVQGLLPGDYHLRVEFARWLMAQMEGEQGFIRKILFTDEAKFSREGIFNHHNSHEWADRNPHNIRERGHQHKFSVNIWAGIVGGHLLGPYIIPDNLTGDVYTTFLRLTLPNMLNDLPPDLQQQLWFQHDGAPAHFSIQAREILNQRFPGRWIGRGGPVAWPPRSPDMTPLDFFLWGHMKSKIYETPVESPEDLVARIAVAAGDIRDNPNILRRVQRSIENRMMLCIEQAGRHFENLL